MAVSEGCTEYFGVLIFLGHGVGCMFGCSPGLMIDLRSGLDLVETRVCHLSHHVVDPELLSIAATQFPPLHQC